MLKKDSRMRFFLNMSTKDQKSSVDKASRSEPVTNLMLNPSQVMSFDNVPSNSPFAKPLPKKRDIIADQPTIKENDDENDS